MKKAVIAFLMSISPALLQAQTKVVNQNKDRNPTSFLSYSLPKNTFTICFKVKHTSYKAGIFADSTETYFGHKPDIPVDSEKWEIVSSTITVNTEPDNAQVYNVYASSNSGANYLSLTPKGILAGVNLPIDQKIESENSTSTSQNKQVEAVEAKEIVDKDVKILAANTPAKAYETFESLQSEKMSMMMQEEDALDGNAVKAYLEEINKHEKQIYSLFNGKTIEEFETRQFTYAPDKECNNQPIVKFSASEGFETGNPITISIKKTRKTQQPSMGNDPVGFVYRVPAYVDVTIKYGTANLFNQNFSVAQLGNLNFLPVKFFDKGDRRAEFDVNTGAMLKLTK